MINFIKNSFKNTNNSLMLVIPLILFLSVLGWYLNFSIYKIRNLWILGLFVITIIVMSAGLVSSWFYMVKQTLQESNKKIENEPKINNLFEIIKKLPTGIGKYFLPFLGFILLYGIINVIVYSISAIILTKYVGPLNINFFTQNNTLITSQEFLKVIRNFSEKDLIIFNYWIITLEIVTCILNFTMMLWIPEMMYKTKNSFYAFFKSLKRTFCNLKKTLPFFIYLKILHLILSIICTIFLNNSILLIFALMITYYYLLYVIIAIFLFYKQEFLNNEE